MVPLLVTVDPAPETVTLSLAVDRVIPLLIVMTQFAWEASLTPVPLLLETVIGQSGGAA